jgi:hypothetical protein
MPHPTHKFDSDWCGAELGAATDGAKTSFPAVVHVPWRKSVLPGIGEARHQIIQDDPIPGLANARATCESTRVS